MFCRDVDGAIVRPLPRVKRLLSEATCLPHIVQVRSVGAICSSCVLSPRIAGRLSNNLCWQFQLLLTFDPVLVEKVALLLYHVMQDNPTLSRLYLSGVFFFILMYTGSNVLPVARFLKHCHLQQAFRSEEVRVCLRVCVHESYECHHKL